MPGDIRVLGKFGPRGGAQIKHNKRKFNEAVDSACTVVPCRLDTYFHSSSTELQAKNIDNIHSLFPRWIHTTGTDPAMAQPHNKQGSIDEGFLHNVPEELIEQANISFNQFGSLVAATKGSM